MSSLQSLRATLEYHFFDDKNAKMANDRQEELKHGTHEFLAGVEYDINEKFTISCGAQRTDYGLSDDYQQNTSFACDRLVNRTGRRLEHHGEDPVECRLLHQSL